MTPIDGKKLAKGFALYVNDAARSLEKQLSIVCSGVHAATKKGKPYDCGAGTACPGASFHGLGFALDICLAPPSGGPRAERTDCSSTVYDTCEAALKGQPARKKKPALKGKVCSDERYLVLDDIMFSLGFWKYCRELWHFELSKDPVFPERTRSHDKDPS
jgi:D-alanyl-D-alanine dipeptidase